MNLANVTLHVPALGTSALACYSLTRCGAQSFVAQRPPSSPIAGPRREWCATCLAAAVAS